MRIVHYLKTFSTPSETFVYDLVRHLELSGGYRNTVLAWQRALESVRPYGAVELLRPLSPVGRFITAGLRRTVAPGLKTAAVGLVAQWRGFQQAEVIHAHFGLNGYHVYQAMRLRGSWKPLVVSCHGTDILYHAPRDPHYHAALVKMSCSGVAFAANSEFLRTRMLDLGMEPSAVGIVNNVAGEHCLRPGPFPARPTEGTLRIVHVGRMVGCKGQRFLVEAAARLANQGISVFLTLVGDGEEMTALRTLTQRLGIAKFVDLRGLVDNRELPGILASHDVYVQPSVVDADTGQTETFGVAVLEALACGLPAVITRVGGMPEIFDGRDSAWVRIVEPGDSQSIADVLADRRWLSADRSGTESERLKILQRYSRQAQLAAVGALYRKVLGLAP